MPNSYSVAVKTKKDRKDWVRNELRFELLDHAQEYATELARRWDDVVATHICMTDDPPNAVFPVPNDTYPVCARTRRYKEREPTPGGR